MDYIMHFPTCPEGWEAVPVLIDRLTKMACFIPTTTMVTAAGTTQLVFSHVFRHHGLLKEIVSDRDPHFISHFWQDLSNCGFELAMSTAYHPQMDG